MCEQLNAWLAGYQSILKRMTPGNFNWFLHAMLFYHTKYVLQKQQRKKENKKEEDLGLDEEGNDNNEQESEEGNSDEQEGEVGLDAELSDDEEVSD